MVGLFIEGFKENLLVLAYNQGAIMCMICLHFHADKLTPFEAMRNLNEMAPIIGDYHTEEVVTMIIESEIQRVEKSFANEIEEENIIPIDFGGLEISFF